MTDTCVSLVRAKESVTTPGWWWICNLIPPDFKSCLAEWMNRP
jgi:hypothetical protein